MYNKQMELVMLWKLIMVEVIVFIVTLFFCRLVVGLLQRYLSMRKYKLTKGFSYIITFLIILITGIVFGKEILYTLL